MDQQRGMKVFIFCKSKRIALICKYDLKKKKIKRKEEKNFLFMWEEVFAYGKANQKGQQRQQTLGFCSSQQRNSNRWCMILETKIIFFL